MKSMKQWINSLVDKVLVLSSLSQKTIPKSNPLEPSAKEPNLSIYQQELAKCSKEFANDLEGAILGLSAKEPPSSKPKPYTNPYNTFIEHLKLREGVVYECYEDSLGKLTAGVGHLLPVDTELSVGSPVSKEEVSEWLRGDSQLAWSSAVSQARFLGRYDDTFIIGLASVNFQLGVGWVDIHTKTWYYLERGKWAEAAREAANSKWNKQTPVRVADFQEAIMSYS